MEELGYIDEHAPRPSREPEGPVDFEPTPEERKLIKKVNKLFDRYRQHRNNYDGCWMEDYKMFRGRQWDTPRPSYRHSEVFNLIFQVIQSQVPIITDSKPKFEFAPSEPGDREFAEIMNEIAAADWQRNNWQYQLTEVIYDGHIYGTGLSYIGFDQKLRQGRGGIKYCSEELFYCYPDPDCRDVNVESRGFIRAEPMTLENIRAKYPDRGRFVKSDTTDLLDATKNDLNPLRFRNPKGEKSIIEGSSKKTPQQEKKAILIEAYFFDDEIEENEIEVEVDLEDGTKERQMRYEQRLKYPRGRRVVIAGDVVLADDPNPFADGEFPWQRWSNYILPREFWGESEVSQIKGPQKIFNTLVSYALDVLVLMGNPIWVVDTTAQVDTDNLVNAPGSIIEKSPSGDVRREQGVSLQPYVLQLIDRIKEYVDQISGAQDVTRGVPSGGVTAASAIQDLQNAAQTRLRQKSRNLDAYLQSLGQQYKSRVMQFYTAPQVFRVTGQDGARKYFRAYFTENPETHGKVVRLQRYHNGLGFDPNIEEYELRGELDVQVTTGTALPFSKAQRKQELLQLFDRGIIDREEYFKQTDYPNWETVADRMAQKEAAAAQAEQQQSAA